MKKNIKEIKVELRKRGFDPTSIKEIFLGGIMISLEDILEKIEKKNEPQ